MDSISFNSHILKRIRDIQFSFNSLLKKISVTRRFIERSALLIKGPDAMMLYLVIKLSSLISRRKQNMCQEMAGVNELIFIIQPAIYLIFVTQD
jgi:hypothetical protein